MRIPPRPTSLAALSTLLLLATLIGLTGCGGGHNGVGVSGKVTVDKVALAKGSIIFKPKSKEAGPQTAAPIENGVYKLESASGPGIGDYDVLIYADQPLEFNMDEPAEFFEHAEEKIPANAIPAKYNTRTTLKVVTKPGDNQFDFDIDTTEGT